MLYRWPSLPANLVYSRFWLFAKTSLKYCSLRFRTQEFIELECEELATIDALREKADKEDSALPTSPFLPNGRPGNNPIKLIIDLLKNEVFWVRFSHNCTIRCSEFFTGHEGGFDFVKLEYLGSRKRPELGYLFISLTFNPFLFIQVSVPDNS